MLIIASISRQLYTRPIDTTTLNEFVSNIDAFDSTLDFFGEVLAVLLIIFSFFLLNLIATSVGIKVVFASYYYRLQEKIMNLFRYKKIILIYTFLFFLLALNNLQIPFLILCWISAMYLLVKYSKMILLVIKSFLNENVENYKRLEYMFLALYLLSIYLAFVWIPTDNQYYLYLSLYQVTIYSIFVLILLICRELLQLIKADYDHAREEKLWTVNDYILDELWEQSGGLIWPKSKKHLEITSYKNRFDLKKRMEFIEALKLTGYSPRIEEELIERYDRMVIEYRITSERQAKVIDSRNRKNLYFSFAPLVGLVVLFILDKGIFTSPILIFKVFFGVVSFRLISRSWEIGHSFYNDIKPDTKIKNSNLSNSERIGLVLKSLVEIVLLCSVIYTLVYLLIEKDISNLPEYYFNGLTHSLATSAFNVSFPYDILSNIKVDSKFYLNIENGVFWSWLTIIQIVHLIQLGMSIVLISLSITSYGSKASMETYFNIDYKKDKYRLQEIVKSTNESKIIFENSSKEEFIETIRQEWGKSQLLKISTPEYLRIRDIMDLSLLKK